MLGENERTERVVAAYRDRRVMVIGGLGFIGSNLARRLVALGARVLIVDSLVPDHGGNFYNVADVLDKLTVNVADIRDQHAINFLVRGQHYIFNLAGQVSHIGSMEDPLTDLDINARAQIFLLEACRWHNPEARIVYASTRQFYGVPQYLPVDEEHPVLPTDVNGITKFAPMASPPCPSASPTPMARARCSKTPKGAWELSTTSSAASSPARNSASWAAAHSSVITCMSMMR